MNLIHLDTGLMYRAVAFMVYQDKVDYVADSIKIINMLKSDKIKFKKNQEGGFNVCINNIDYTNSLQYVSNINKITSEIAKISEIREYLTWWQRSIAEEYDIVMSGRDICSNVLKDIANLKIFLTASVQERAKRRLRQLRNLGIHRELLDVKKEILLRDKTDSERQINRLMIPSDAVIIDSTCDSVSKTASLIMALLESVDKSV